MRVLPIAEGFLGPLRVPLSRASAVLDAPHYRQAIDPAVPLNGCPTYYYLGRFHGAGCDASTVAVAGRWL